MAMDDTVVGTGQDPTPHAGQQTRPQSRTRAIVARATYGRALGAVGEDAVELGRVVEQLGHPLAGTA